MGKQPDSDEKSLFESEHLLPAEDLAGRNTISPDG